MVSPQAMDQGGQGVGDAGRTKGRIPSGSWGTWTLDRVLVIAGFAAAVLAVVVLGTVDSALVGPFLIILLPGMVSTGLLLWKPRRGFYLIAGFANSLLAISAIPFGLIGALANPLVGPVYNAVVLSVLSLILALPSGVLGFLRGRSGLVERSLAEGIHSLQGLAVIAVIALSVGAMAAGSLAYQNLNAPPGPTGPSYDMTNFVNVSMAASNSRFSPNAINITSCVVTRITILNEDDMPHTFTYTNNQTTYSHDLPAGSTTRFFVLFVGPGTVLFRSVAPGDSGMNGTITVVSP